MNDYQRELASDCYYLVQEIMEQKGLSENDVEDWHGILSIALCHAAINYCQDDLIEFKDFAKYKMIESLNEYC